MSTSSRTPDDKMHRYLQRIQKLVGHRPKSPTIVKSRLKSPINLKTPKLDNLIKHEMFIKSIVNFCYQQHNKWKCHFIDQLWNISQNILDENIIERQLKPITSMPQCRINIKPVDKSLQIRFIIKPIQSVILKTTKQAFILIKQHIKQSQILTRDIKPSPKNLHRRTYSEIYAESVRSHYKSPSPIRQYQYKTPSVLIKRPSNQQYPHQKLTQTRFLCCILQRLKTEKIVTSFSSIKSVYSRTLYGQLQHAYNQIQALSKQLSSAKNQISMINEERDQKSRLLQQKEKQIGFVLNKVKQENQQTHIQRFAQYQNTINTNHATACIFTILNRKYTNFITYSLHTINNYHKNTSNPMTKYIYLANVLKHKIASIKKQCFKKLYIQSAFINLQNSLQKQRSLIPSQINIHSLYSSKLSNASLKSASSNFDLLAKKINKAFELKTTLTEIYSFAFQKIDYVALLYLGISSPLQKMLGKTLKQAFCKILFFSFQQSQQQQSQGQHKVNHESVDKLFIILERLNKKQLFIKIQAYSLIKLNWQLRKTVKMKDAIIIQQVQLRKQIKDFLQQRNKMHQKACQTWQKTKDLLKDSTFTQSKITASSRILN